VSGPRVTSGTDSEQVVGTPRELLTAVEARFGALEFDLAATAHNCVVPRYMGDLTRFYGPGSARAEDALAEEWEDRDGNLWLNPPFAKIKPWARKCAETPAGPTTRRILFLVPLATANWACDYVHGKALVLALVPRVKFVGHKTAFPKDLMIAVYGAPPGFEVWQWKPRRTAKGSRKKIPDAGVTSRGQSTLPNACDVDCAAAIPRSENDGTETRTETGAVPPGRTCEVETRPGEQRPLSEVDPR
jgi:hypothetical protein